jgi:hypothetical protein
MSRLIATAGHDNPGALLSEGQRRGAADPGQGAGDQDDGCAHGYSPLTTGCIAEGSAEITTSKAKADQTLS